MLPRLIRQKAAIIRFHGQDRWVEREIAKNRIDTATKDLSHCSYPYHISLKKGEYRHESSNSG
jgi:hypothetical protein